MGEIQVTREQSAAYAGGDPRRVTKGVGTVYVSQDSRHVLGF